MKEIQIYTKNITHEECKECKVFDGYNVILEDLDLTKDVKLRAKMPMLFLIRILPPQGNTAPKLEWQADKKARLWSFLDNIPQGERKPAVVVWTSEKDYEFFYECINHHIDAVILEPAKENEVEEKLRWIMTQLERNERLVEERHRLEQYEFNKRALVMSRILKQVLEKPEDVDYLLPEINKRYGTDLGANNYMAFIISVSQFELYNADSNFLQEVSQMVFHYVTSAHEIILGQEDPYGLIVIMNFIRQNVSAKQLENELEELRLAILGLQEKYGEFSASISVGGMVKSLSQIQSSLRRAAYAQEFRMHYHHTVLYADKLPDVERDLNDFLPDRSIRELCRYISMGDVEHIRIWYSYFYNEVERAFIEYPPAYAKFCWKMYLSVKEMAKATKIPMFPDMKFFALQHRFEGHERMKEMETLLMEISHLMQSTLSTENEVALHSIAYMKVHYAEPITLDVLAEACGISTSYFSRKFKEQAGENYINVLTEIRIREAERLLAETDKSIEEILYEVGYCDDKHFRTLFQKHTGMSPSQYRKKRRNDRVKIAMENNRRKKEQNLQ